MSLKTLNNRKKSHKIDFPELTLLPVKRLKEFNKKTKNMEHKKLIKNLIKSIEANAEFIKIKRQNVRSGLNQTGYMPRGGH